MTELAKSGEIIEAEVVLASLGRLGATEPTAIPDAFVATSASGFR